MNSVFSIDRRARNVEFPLLLIRNIPFHNLSQLDEYEDSLPPTERYYFRKEAGDRILAGMNILHDIQQEFWLKTQATKTWIHLGLEWDDVKGDWVNMKKAVKDHEANKKVIAKTLRGIEKNWGKKRALIFQKSAGNELKQIQACSNSIPDYKLARRILNLQILRRLKIPGGGKSPDRCIPRAKDWTNTRANATLNPQPISRSQLRALNFHLDGEGIIQPGRRLKNDSDLDSVTSSGSVVAEDSSNESDHQSQSQQATTPSQSRREQPCREEPRREQPRRNQRQGEGQTGPVVGTSGNGLEKSRVMKNSCRCSKNVPQVYKRGLDDDNWISIRDGLFFLHAFKFFSYRLCGSHLKQLRRHLALSECKDLLLRINALHKARGDSDLKRFLIRNITWFQTPLWIEGRRGLDKHGKFIVWKSSSRTELGERTSRSSEEVDTDQGSGDQEESSTSDSEDQELISDHESHAEDLDDGRSETGESENHAHDSDDSGNYLYPCYLRFKKKTVLMWTIKITTNQTLRAPRTKMKKWKNDKSFRMY